MLCVAVQLDALRHDYLASDAPFLQGLAASGSSGRLAPTFGFEPDAAYLAGLYPDEADGGAQFWHEPENSPFRFSRSWPEVFDRLPRFPARVFRRLLSDYARKRTGLPFLTAARIPVRLLSHFGSPMKLRLDQPGFTPRDTVFDLLRRHGRQWLVHAPPDHPVTMCAALHRAEAELRPPLDFAFFHVADLDGVGHTFGPNSTERHREMAAVDAGLRALHDLAAKRFGDVHWVIFGDHGMAEVRSHLDIQAVLRTLPCKLCHDYLAFLDSTMARFWFFNPQCRAALIQACSPLNGGHWLTSEERSRYHLNYPHNRFGDETFLVDPGWLILPNFYQGREPVRGMHGYAPETPDQQSAFVISSPAVGHGGGVEEPLDMRRLFPTLLQFLALPVPGSCSVKTLPPTVQA